MSDDPLSYPHRVLYAGHRYVLEAEVEGPMSDVTSKARFDLAEMMHGDGYVAVLKRVPCPDHYDCLAHRERVLTLTAAAARELAAELLRGARYVEERSASDLTALPPNEEDR